MPSATVRLGVASYVATLWSLAAAPYATPAQVCRRTARI